MKKLLVLALFAVLPTMGTPAEVVMVLDPDKIAVLAKIAAAESRYPLPAKLPTVVVMSPDFFPIPNMLGLFSQEKPDYIFLNAATPVDLQATVLVHELVHFLQYSAGTLPAAPDCATRLALEAEAYVAAYRFELEYLPFHHELNVDASNCKNMGLPE